MNELDLDIRPIAMDEWLPDRCLVGGEPIDPARLTPQAGCSSLCWFYTATALGISREESLARPLGEVKEEADQDPACREMLVELYRETIETHGGCGFVAWLAGKIVGYHTFFPRDIARRIRFFGWGEDAGDFPATLVHNCITHIRGEYSRKKIGTRLARTSLAWAKDNGWTRFEVHLVLPDIEDGFRSEQKSCRTFWEKLGLSVYRTEPASEVTRDVYGVDVRYSMVADLKTWTP
jgi:GNAT superfamily N-acetyltransferase